MELRGIRLEVETPIRRQLPDLGKIYQVAITIKTYSATSHKISVAHKHKLFLWTPVSMSHCDSGNQGYLRSVYMTNRSTRGWVQLHSHGHVLYYSIAHSKSRGQNQHQQGREVPFSHGGWGSEYLLNDNLLWHIKESEEDKFKQYLGDRIKQFWWLILHRGGRRERSQGFCLGDGADDGATT